MEGLLRSIMPPLYKNDKIREMAEYLESLGISSMKDMHKTDETALKKSNHFNVISVGKIKDYLRKGIDMCKPLPEAADNCLTINATTKSDFV